MNHRRNCRPRCGGPFFATEAMKLRSVPKGWARQWRDQRREGLESYVERLLAGHEHTDRSRRAKREWRPLPPAAAVLDDLDTVRPDLLAQRIAIKSQQVSRLDLVSTTGIERHGDQRRLDLVDDPLIHARWR